MHELPDRNPFPHSVKIVVVKTFLCYTVSARLYRITQRNWHSERIFEGQFDVQILPSPLAKNLLQPARIRMWDQGTSKERAVDLLQTGKVSGEKVVVKFD